MMAQDIGFDYVNVFDPYAKVSLSITKNESGKIVALSLNMNGDPYRWYDPARSWNIRLAFPPPKSIPYTGMF